MNAADASQNEEYENHKSPHPQQFYIWWLSQHDIDHVKDLNINIGSHGYIWEQIVSMDGRPKRGRLWIADCINEILPEDKKNGISEDAKNNMWNYLSQNCGGIVIRGAEAFKVCGLPGVLTDYGVTTFYHSGMPT